MKNDILCYLILCKRQLKSLLFLFLLFLLPIAAFYFTSVSPETEANETRIALYCSSPDAVTETLFESLMTMDSMFTFYTEEDEAGLLQAVQTEKAACGYLFPPDYQKFLDDGDYRRKITVYTSPGTLLESLCSEVVFSTLFSIYSKELLYSYLKTEPLFSEAVKTQEFFSIFQERYAYFQDKQRTFYVEYELLEQDFSISTLDSDDTYVTFPFRSCLSVLLFAAALTGGLTAYTDQKNGIPLSPLRSISIPVLLLQLSGLLLLRLTGNWNSLLTEGIGLLGYGCLLILYTRLLLHFCRPSALYQILLPLLLLSSLILCPIFIDLQRYFPGVSSIRWFLPPTWYLTFCQNV